MKGFIYLLEISVALILMLVVVGTISSFKSKENWERGDLIQIGNDVLETLKSEDIVQILNGNLSKVERLIPPHINFGLKVNGIPKSNISVGCVDVTRCDYANDLLTDAYVNGHWINFTVEQFDIYSLNYIPSYYDAVVFVNYTNYSDIKSNITNYLNKGGVVIGNNATFNNNDANLKDIFGLNPTGSSGGVFNFTTYNPSEDEIEKYFLGIGFDVDNSYDSDVKCSKGYNISQGGAWGYIYPASDNCGGLGSGCFYVDGSTGFIVFNTTYLPQDGNYTITFDYNRGSPGQLYENFSVGCGNQVYNFPDYGENENWRWKSITCNFTKGFNKFNFTSKGPNSVWFDSFRITATFYGMGNGTLIVWQDSRKVNITSTIDIENKTTDEGLIKNIPEGGTFKLKAQFLDNLMYTFKVKKIWPQNRVDIQPVNASFVFKDFSETNAVIGKFNIVSLATGQAEMTSNKTAIWISDFPWSNEYRTLVKAAIASRVKEWYAKEPNLTKEHAIVSSFYPLCCDMPETVELTLYLWYKL